MAQGWAMKARCTLVARRRMLPRTLSRVHLYTHCCLRRRRKLYAMLAMGVKAFSQPSRKKAGEQKGLRSAGEERSCKCLGACIHHCRSCPFQPQHPSKTLTPTSPSPCPVLIPSLQRACSSAHCAACVPSHRYTAITAPSAGLPGSHRPRNSRDRPPSMLRPPYSDPFTFHISQASPF